MRVVGSVAATDEIDVDPPSAPSSLVAIPVSAQQIDLSWTAASDNVAVAGYQIFRDLTPLTTVAGTSYSDLGLTPDTQYSYEVVAFDAAGNNSTPSNTATATTNTNSAPVWSLTDQTLDQDEAYTLILDTVCNDADGDVLQYALDSGTLPAGLALSGTRNELLSGTPTTVETQQIGLSADDGIAAPTVLSVEFDVVSPDVTPPAAPAAPTVQSFTDVQIILALPISAAGDHAYYEVERSTDAVNYGQRADNVTTSTWVDNGLTADTTYYYRLIDVDTSGNRSAPGAVVSQTTLGSNLLFVYPFMSPSIFDNDTIPNQDAELRWRVVNESPLDGVFEYFRGGGFRYTAGAQTGTAQFTYQILDFDGLGGNTQAVVSVVVGTLYAVFPIVPGGIFDGPNGDIITNASATWRVTAFEALDGTFNFYEGGAWDYTAGSQTGTASFDWEVNNYDGLGSTSGARFSFAVF